ncbi:uncharacterized protein NPIL_119511, partial [Nephila pilipes]
MMFSRLTRGNTERDVTKLRIGSYTIFPNFLILLWITGISEVHSSAVKMNDVNDIDFSDLNTLNFTCSYDNDCNESRSDGTDHLNQYNCICDHNCLLYDYCCLDSEFRPRTKIPEPEVQVKCLSTYGPSTRDVLMIDSCGNPGTVNDLCTSNGEDWNDL